MTERVFDLADDDKEQPRMNPYASVPGPADPDPADVLHRLAHETAPPSRMDIARAARDGFRLRRRRRLARSMTGVAAAGVVATVAVLVPAHLHDAASTPATSSSGTAGSGTAAVCPTAPGEVPATLGSDQRIQVPGKFGWLPTDQVSQIDETIRNYHDSALDSGASSSDP